MFFQGREDLFHDSKHMLWLHYTLLSLQSVRILKTAVFVVDFSSYNCQLSLQSGEEKRLKMFVIKLCGFAIIPKYPKKEPQMHFTFAKL